MFFFFYILFRLFFFYLDSDYELFIYLDFNACFIILVLNFMS